MHYNSWATRVLAIGMLTTPGFSTGQDSVQTFVEVTSTAGISGGAGSWAGAWGDFDKDGDLDVMTLGHLQPALGGKNQLWRNSGDGTFTDVTVDVGMISDKIDTHGAVWADLDRDGDLDLYLVNESITDKPQLYHELWRNNANGTFTDVAEAAGVIGHDHITRGVGAADYDRDGLLDILPVVQNMHRFPNAPPSFSPNNLLYRNLGALAFVDEAVSSGLAYPEGGEKRTVAWGDYDGDGWPDAIILPDCGLFRNQGDGTFLEASEAAGIPKSAQCQGAGWADYDNDGHLDLFVSRGFDIPTPSSLYRNNGDGTFTDVTVASGIVNNELARAVTWGDYDNDGNLDLYVVNFRNSRVPNRLFRNNGDGTFTDVTSEAGVGAQVAGGGAHANFVDYDNDGDLDLFVTNGEATTTGPYVLLQNTGNANRWFKLKLIGTASNPDAIGARVKLETDTAIRYATHTGPAHWMSQSSMPVHFGLGQETGISRITLSWPSGKQQRLENLAADQSITVEESRALWLGMPTFGASGFYVWQSGKRWAIAWKGANAQSQFSGTITSNGAFQKVTTKSFEADDSITWSSAQISFAATDDGRHLDSIEFETSGRVVTFDIKQDGVAQPQSVYMGRYLIKPATLPLRLQ